MTQRKLDALTFLQRPLVLGASYPQEWQRDLKTSKDFQASRFKLAFPERTNLLTFSIHSRAQTLIKRLYKSEALSNETPVHTQGPAVPGS